jgi:hypothetical protein
MEKLAYLLIGWVLGLIGPLIVDAFKISRRRKEVAAALRVELEELRYRLAVSSFLLISNQGRLNKDFLTWVAPIIENYRGNEPNEAAAKFVKQLVTLEEAQIDELARQKQSNEAIASRLKTQRASFLESHLAEIAKMPISTQRKIHEFRNQLQQVNEEIPKIDSLYMLTFNSSLSERNYEIVKHEVRNRTAFVQQKYRLAADKISAILWDL